MYNNKNQNIIIHRLLECVWNENNALNSYKVYLQCYKSSIRMPSSISKSGETRSRRIFLMNSTRRDEQCRRRWTSPKNEQTIILTVPKH